jgi:hypothetical protein
MRVEEIEETCGAFPHEALSETIKTASEAMDTIGVIP